MALIDHRDAAEAGLRVLTDPALWGAHHDLTGPVPLSRRGRSSGLITRERAILAGENDYTTGTFGQITGRPPRPLAEFLHQYRAEFA